MLTHGFTLSITFMLQRTQALPTTAFIVDSFVYLFTTFAFDSPLSANDSLLAQRLTGKRPTTSVVVDSADRLYFPALYW